MNQTMNDLALLAIGAGFGLALCLVAGLSASLVWSASKQREQTRIVHKLAINSLDQNAQAMAILRTDLSAALSKLDSERLYSSSIAIQRSAKQLGAQVDQLQKVVFAQPPSPAIDFTAGGMEDEAVEDARMIADRNRWQREAGGNLGVNPYQPVNHPPADPLAGLSEEDRRQRILEYFERQRARTAGFPYPVDDRFQPASTPPAAGSGIYSSLLDEASQLPPLHPPAPDFSGMEIEEGVDLVDKGELS